MPVDFDAVRFSPHNVSLTFNEGEEGGGHVVVFQDYPRLSYRWQSFRGAALEREGVAERVTWFCDGIECPDFDTAIARMQNETAAEGQSRG